MKIPQPSLSPHHPDYDLSCQVALDLPIQELVEGAVQAGWRRADVLSALEEIASSRALVYQKEPDPQDDAAEDSFDKTAPAFSDFNVE